MNICGIVTEYNPFHNGHLKHIEETKKLTGSDYIIAVMSGNFVQRGEPAVIDKFARTETALLNGVDMVIELPVYYATASAEYFAKAAISILENSGIVGSVCFGSESGDITALKAVAHQLLNEDDEFKLNIKHALSEGVSYPKARQEALEKCENLPYASLNEPNNILGIEYLKAIESLNSSIKPFTIKRQGAPHHSQNISNNSIASSTAIRKIVCGVARAELLPYVCERIMPKNCFDILQQQIDSKNILNSINDFSDILHYIIATGDPSILNNIVDMDEGLENRIIACAQNHYSITAIAEAVKTKRYVLTKIKRAIIHTILSITKQDFNFFNNNGYSQYIRVLGFKKQSEHLLKILQENAKIPVVTNLKYAEDILSESAMRMLRKELEATQIYQLALRKNNSQIKPELSSYIVIV